MATWCGSCGVRAGPGGEPAVSARGVLAWGGPGGNVAPVLLPARRWQRQRCAFLAVRTATGKRRCRQAGQASSNREATLLTSPAPKPAAPSRTGIASEPQPQPPHPAASARLRLPGSPQKSRTQATTLGLERPGLPGRVSSNGRPRHPGTATSAARIR